MTDKLTPGQQRLAAVALLLCVLTLAMLAVAWPLRALHQHYDDALELAGDRLARYSKIAGVRGEVLAGIQRINTGNPTKFYLKNASPALAAAEIQDFSKKAVESSGAKLVSMQILPHKDEGDYRQVSVNVQLTASLGNLKNIFLALETARPLLFLDNVSIRSPMGYTPKIQTTVEPELIIQFDLSGYALNPKGGA